MSDQLSPRILASMPSDSLERKLVKSSGVDEPDGLRAEKARLRLEAFLADQAVAAPVVALDVSVKNEPNEQSEVFSLAQLAHESPSPAKMAGAARGDDSGLIDIKSMTFAQGSLDILRGVGGEAPLLSPLAGLVPAPVVVATPSEPKPAGRANTTVFASVIGASLILVGGALGAIWLLRSGQPTTTVGVEAAPNAAQVTAGAVGAAAPGVATPSAAGAAPGVAPSVAGAAGAPSAAGAAAPSTGSESAGSRGSSGSSASGSSRGSRGSRGSASPSSGASGSSGSSGSSAAAAPSAPPTPSTGSSAPVANPCVMRCRGDIACLIGCGRGGSSASSSGSSASASGPTPESPGRSDVLGAMSRVSVPVRACANGQTGIATVQVTFASSGRVTTAEVGPPFAGTPTGSCIARAVRSATVPAFTRATFQVNYPFRL
ncbi:MAG: hypothetical protein Q8Q09_23755 [Deltaproteobacteria bacterium]|nr:hypothetical protein [Deltaproteobacteria bacterium]